MKGLDAARRKRSDDEYIRRYLWAIPTLRSDVVDDIPKLRALDIVRSRLMGALDAHNIRLWDNIKLGGRLEYEVTRIQTAPYRRSRRRETYATIRGYNLISPYLDSFEIRYRQLEQSLAKLDFGPDWEEIVFNMSEPHRRELASLFREALKQIIATQNDVLDAKQFLGAVTIVTLRSWSQELRAGSSLTLVKATYA